MIGGPSRQSAARSSRHGRRTTDLLLVLPILSNCQRLLRNLTTLPQRHWSFIKGRSLYRRLRGWRTYCSPIMLNSLTIALWEEVRAPARTKWPGSLVRSGFTKMTSPHRTWDISNHPSPSPRTCTALARPSRSSLPYRPGGTAFCPRPSRRSAPNSGVKEPFSCERNTRDLRIEEDSSASRLAAP